MKIYRHGDLLIREIKTIPEKAKIQKDNVLAEGEFTGHSHRLKAKQQLVYAEGENKYLNIKQKTELVHQEHDTLVLEVGEYEVIIEREYNPFKEAIEQVQD